jgi:hypothetical protein
LGSQHAIFMPGAANTMTPAFLHGHNLAELSVSMKVFLDGGVHDTRRQRPASMLTSIKYQQVWKAKPELFTKGEKRRGADSTRSHERHREAPLRETRQAAPDGARASAALSSSESSRFSRGTKPMRRKSYGFIGMSSFAANPIAGDTFSKFRRRLQPSRTGRKTSRRPATLPGDENLEANSRRRRKAQGGTEATTRSILELSTAALPSPLVFIAVPATSRMARQANCNPVKINGRRNVL